MNREDANLLRNIYKKAILENLLKEFKERDLTYFMDSHGYHCLAKNNSVMKFKKIDDIIEYCSNKKEQCDSTIEDKRLEQWVYVSNRLPERGSSNSYDLLVVLKDGRYLLGNYNCDYDKWKVLTDMKKNYKRCEILKTEYVLAWMKLPVYDTDKE